MGEIVEFPKQLKPDEEFRALLPDRSPPAKIARIDQTERWNTGGRFGDLRASQLTSILARADKGDIRSWMDLCDFMLEDDLVGSLHQTRVLRVTQSDWVISPRKTWSSKAERTAELAAEMVNELMDRVRNWSAAQKKLLHAIAAGFSCAQKIWEHDRVRRCYWVRELEWAHNHRFTYDEQWQLRLWDQGATRGGGSNYGRALDPDLWVVHRHQPNAGYPGKAGQLRQIAMLWLFRRWVDKFHIGTTEVAGKPIPYVQVPANTTRAAREQIRADLQDIANGSAGVINDDVTIAELKGAAETKSWDAFIQYLQQSERRLVTNYLGASDAVQPGANGSQAAVSTRVGATMDPRMVDDGDALSVTLQDGLFASMLKWNAHLIGCPFDQIPVPEMRRKTADDEAQRDPTDRAAEIGNEMAARGAGQGNLGPDGRPLPGVTPPQLQAHADAAAKAAQAVADDAENDDPPEGGDPKARARASTRAARSRGMNGTRSRATSGRSLSPLERALSGELVGSVRSSTKR